MEQFSARIKELQNAIDNLGPITSQNIDAKLFLLQLQTKEIEAQRNYWVEAAKRQLGNITSMEKAA